MTTNLLGQNLTEAVTTCGADCTCDACTLVNKAVELFNEKPLETLLQQPWLSVNELARTCLFTAAQQLNDRVYFELTREEQKDLSYEVVGAALAF